MNSKRKEYCKAYYLKTKERQKAQRIARRLADPQRHLAKQRERYYGISPDDAEALFEAQDRRCAICHTDTPNGRGTWHLDHDHRSGKVRGFLCQGCNNGLGFFRDDPLRLELAARYLRENTDG
jgi:hypothetical protein